MVKWNTRQKQLMAEFLSNFALAWLTLGLIAPIFTRIENILYFVIRLILTAGVLYWSLKVATELVE